MKFSIFKNYISSIRTAPLGGTATQFMLAPSYRKKYELEKIQALKPIKAGVLLLFFPNNNGETTFLLIKRPNYKGYHANQISFPGGKKEKGDKDLLATAIRETQEEVGINVSRNWVFKQLTEIYIPPSNFIVDSYMAILDNEPSFTTNHEVEACVLVNLSELLNPNNIQSKEVIINEDKQISTPCFVFNNEIVWGATAMILSEVRGLFKSTLPK